MPPSVNVPDPRVAPLLVGFGVEVRRLVQLVRHAGAPGRLQQLADRTEHDFNALTDMLLRLRAEYPGTHFDDLLAQEKLSATELSARLRDQLTLERRY